MVNVTPRRKGLIISVGLLIAFGLVFLIEPIVQDYNIQMIFFSINCIIGSKSIVT